MAFDLSTARPVSPAPPPGGFDLSTAKPVDEGYWDRVVRTGSNLARAEGTGWRGAGRSALGAVEDVAAMGSGVVGDVAGAATSIATQNPTRGEAVRNALTYQPRTQVGKAGQQFIGAVTAPVAAVVNAPVAALEKHGHPILGQTLRAGMDVAGGEEATAARGIRAATRAPEVARAVRESEADGFVLPVSQSQPGVISKLSEVGAGKIHTQQALSAKNSELGNMLVRRGLGLAEDAPLDADTMAAIRRQAGAKYEAVKNIPNPTVTPGKTFTDQLTAIADSRKGAIRADRADDPVVVAATELKNAGSFTTSQALNEIRTLRDQADGAFRAGDKRLGSDFKNLAGAVEGAIEQHLKSTGAPASMLADFRAARTRIAQSYDVEKALDGAGGVDLAKLGTRYAKGGMTGPLATAGRFGQRFGRKYGQTPAKTGSRLPTSLLGAAATEAVTAGLAGRHALAAPGVVVAGGIAGRMALQKLSESRAGQGVIGAVQGAARKGTRAAARTAAAAPLFDQYDPRTWVVDPDKD